jgi:hypothetical protein
MELLWAKLVALVSKSAQLTALNILRFSGLVSREDMCAPEVGGLLEKTSLGLHGYRADHWLWTFIIGV